MSQNYAMYYTNVKRTRNRGTYTKMYNWVRAFLKSCLFIYFLYLIQYILNFQYCSIVRGMKI